MNIHLVMPFSRPENKEKVLSAYRDRNVILHPIMFEDEPIEFSEPWVRPFVIKEKATDCTVMMPGTYKRNRWIEANNLEPDSYYVTADDDDNYEAGVFEAVRSRDSDIVIISMKRGNQVPAGVEPHRAYATSTLIASPENMRIGRVSAQQMFVKGRLFKEHPHNEESHCWDGELAEHYQEMHKNIVFLPKIYALLNYFEQGRWTHGLKVSFGVMTNMPSRLSMALQQSEITGDLHYVSNPESGTKGLNKLLDRIEADGADVAILTHHDMSFRNPWLPRIKEKLAELPETWVVAGIIGKDMKGRICGKMSDSRIPVLFNTADVHTFPVEASCFDECLIFVNMKTGFRFDETLDGFDLYGTLCVLQTWEMGGTAWVIDSGAYSFTASTEHGPMSVDVALATHHCTRPFSWFPDESFQRNFKWLYDRFTNAERLDTTVIGLPPGQEARFETSAA